MKCKCGRDIIQRNNSTIRIKKCPNCLYVEAIKKKKRPAENKIKEKKPKTKRIAWRDKSTADMVIYVQHKICNKYIRARDNVNFNCRSISDRGRISDAGHYYSVGAKAGMRFCVQNIHGQSRSGNTFKGGDLINYRKGLIERHGEDYINELDTLAMLSEGGKSLDRYNVLRIGETYLYLLKNKIWVFRDKEFNKFKVKLTIS